MAFLVLSAGFQTTVQDCGRFQFRKSGVTLSGALDSATLRVLNFLVGNDERAAGIEMSNGRIRLKFSDDRIIGWGGGNFDVRIGSNNIPSLHCASVSRKDACEISPKRGRAWLAISGGIDVPEILGSRSTDLRARFGGFEGRALRDGDELPLGASSAQSGRIREQINGHVASWSGPVISPSRAKLSLRIIRGKNWNDETGLLETKFRVGMKSDRMGLRLEGPGVELCNRSELVSEAVAPGTIQLPPDGNLIMLLADCQTTGGYPKLAHVITVDLARAAQLQPMDEVAFELTTLEHARELLREREHDIALFRAGLEARFG
jgi:antagonist of KipI